MSDFIEYSPPKATADEAAKKAIAALEDVEKLGGDSLYYCVQASNILALAGLRTISPYNEFAEDFSDEKITQLDEALQKHGVRIMEQDDYGYSESKDFCLMNIDALQASSEVYPILKKVIAPPPNVAWSLYKDWIHLLWSFFAGEMNQDEGVLPKKWLADWWSPHTISFGMMLGYPGIALEDGCERGIGTLDRESDMDWADVEIINNDRYDGTDVGYAVSKEHTNHPEIKQHAELWRQTLDKVYAAFSDERLTAAAGFTEEKEKAKK